MPKSMLINVILEEESRVAIVDNGVLDFFEIETLTKGTLKGNIYKATVENVNASLEAAFVNCGWERPGFLPLDEVNFRVLPSIKGRKSGSRIFEHVVPGMELLVQVIRDKFNNKPPSLTTYYSLPGRYLVLTPYTDGGGVSRKIEDEKQRLKLKNLVEELNPPEKYSVIVRTAGLDQSRHELVRDLGYLIHLWETIERAGSAAPAPTMIYRERGLALRTVRDHLTDDIEEVLIDDEEVYESALRFIRAVAPHQEPRIKLYSGDKPLFTRFNLEDQIETIYKRRVPLKSGGEIVIETTEAMTTIDVNSSRSRETNVDELALRTNLEASAEIARQLRLRDIGGLIVVDYIDMEQPKHLRAVEKALLDAMRRDKAKFDATRISKLGMLEISRQRLKAAKSAATYEKCAACDGAGTVRTTEAAAMAALRRIQTRVVQGDIGTLTATAPTDVALYLLNQQRDELLALERRYDVRISLIPRPDYPKERCEIEATGREGPALPAARDESRRREVREVREVRDSRDGREAGETRDKQEGRSAPSKETPQPGRTAGGRPGAPKKGPGDAEGPASAESPQGAPLIRVDESSASRGSEAAETASPERGPGPAGEAVPGAATGRDEEEYEGKIVWEDVEEIGEPSSVSVQGGIPIEEREAGRPAGGDLAAVGPERKKRRRKRGGKGRKKKPGAGLLGEPVAVVKEAKAPQSAAKRPQGSGPGRGGGRAKATGTLPGEVKASRPRRKRKHHHDRDGVAIPANAAGTRSRTSAATAEAHPSPSQGGEAPTAAQRGASQGIDEDAPGGWWSRLVAPKKRGDRDDE